MADTGQKPHIFHEGNPLAERNTRWAVILTAITMVVEIAGGWFYNSMALLADGWHMSSHVLALGLTVIAYGAARRFAHDRRFSFGTWKIEVLGAYTSALFLAAIAGLMLYHSIERLISPADIHYDQAIIIAVVGLTVNLACAWLLRNSDTHHHHSHEHEHEHEHEHISHHKDLNLRSAYIHVLTDAATSILAIVALTGGKLWGADWLDPAMGILGAAIILIWAYSLLRETIKVLLDAEMDDPLTEKVRQTITNGSVSAEITDLHIWRVGRNKYAGIISVNTNESTWPDDFKKLLDTYPQLVHVTVEINRTASAGT